MHQLTQYFHEAAAPALEYIFLVGGGMLLGVIAVLAWHECVITKLRARMEVALSEEQSRHWSLLGRAMASMRTLLTAQAVASGVRQFQIGLSAGRAMERREMLAATEAKRLPPAESGEEPEAVIHFQLNQRA